MIQMIPLPLLIVIATLAGIAVVAVLPKGKPPEDILFDSARQNGWTHVHILEKSRERQFTWPWNDRYVTVFYVEFNDHAGKPRRSMCRVDSKEADWEA